MHNNIAWGQMHTSTAQFIFFFMRTQWFCSPVSLIWPKENPWNTSLSLIFGPSGNTWSVPNECIYSNTSARLHSRNTFGWYSIECDRQRWCVPLHPVSVFVFNSPSPITISPSPPLAALCLSPRPLNRYSDSPVWRGLGLTARLDEIAHLFFGGESAAAEAEWHRRSCMRANFPATQNRFAITQEYKQGMGYFCARLMFLTFFRLSSSTCTPSLHT